MIIKESRDEEEQKWWRSSQTSYKNLRRRRRRRWWRKKGIERKHLPLLYSHILFPKIEQRTGIKNMERKQCVQEEYQQNKRKRRWRRERERNEGQATQKRESKTIYHNNWWWLVAAVILLLLSLHPFNRIRDQEKRGEPRKGKKGSSFEEGKKEFLFSKKRRSEMMKIMGASFSLSLFHRTSFSSSIRFRYPDFGFFSSFFFLFFPTDQFCSLSFFWISTGVCFTQFSLTAPFSIWILKERDPEPSS